MNQDKSPSGSRLVAVLVLLLLVVALVVMLNQRGRSPGGGGGQSFAVPSYGPLAAAIEQSRALGVPIYLHFRAEWCGPCKSFEKEVLHQADVKAAMEGKIIELEVDVDKAGDVGKHFGVQGIPAGMFVRAEGDRLQVLYSHVGGLEKLEFLKLVEHYGHAVKATPSTQKSQGES